MLLHRYTKSFKEFQVFWRFCSTYSRDHKWLTADCFCFAVCVDIISLKLKPTTGFCLFYFNFGFWRHRSRRHVLLSLEIRKRKIPAVNHLWSRRFTNLWTIGTISKCSLEHAGPLFHSALHSAGQKILSSCWLPSESSLDRSPKASNPLAVVYRLHNGRAHERRYYKGKNQEPPARTCNGNFRWSGDGELEVGRPHGLGVGRMVCRANGERRKTMERGEGGRSRTRRKEIDESGTYSINLNRYKPL